MVAATDWTLIITTLGAAFLAGGFGYLAARRQGEVALHQIEAENERLREQHREDQRRERQATYHAFLTFDREAVAAFGGGGMVAESGEAMRDWFREFGRLASGVMLFGDPTARDATLRLLNLYGELAGEVAPSLLEDDDPAEASRKMAAAWAARSDEVNDLRDAVLEAMRADVGQATR